MAFCNNIVALAVLMICLSFTAQCVNAANNTIIPYWLVEKNIGSRDTAYACKFDDDSSVFCVGPSLQNTNGSSMSFDYLVMKLNKNDGSYYLPFGNNKGYVLTNFDKANRTDIATCFDYQDNYIVVGGESVIDIGNGSTRIFFTIARYNELTGELDENFGDHGKVILRDPQAGANQEIFDIIASSESIWVVGFVNPGFIVGAGPAFDCGVAKFHYNGSLDTSFANEGRLTIDYLAQDERCRSIVTNNDFTEFIVGARTKNVNVTDFSLALAKIDDYGNYDSSYGNQVDIYGPGKTVEYFNGNYVVVNTIAVNKNDLTMGTISLGNWNGWDNKTSGRNVGLVTKFDGTGILDTTWGDNGKAIINYDNSTFDVYGLKNHEGYTYVSGGIRIAGGSIKPFISRVNTHTGEFDYNFECNGIYIENIENNGFFRSIDISDNQIVCGGEVYVTQPSTANILVASYVFDSLTPNVCAPSTVPVSIPVPESVPVPLSPVMIPTSPSTPVENPSSIAAAHVGLNITHMFILTLVFLILYIW